MLCIRLKKVGKKNRPFFRIVLTRSTKSPQGEALEILGFYNPLTKEKKLSEERIKYWLSRGVQPSKTVNNLLIDFKILEGLKLKAHSTRGRKKKKKAKEALEEDALKGKTVEAKEKPGTVPKGETGAKEKPEELVQGPPEAQSEAAPPAQEGVSGGKPEDKSKKEVKEMAPEEKKPEKKEKKTKEKPEEETK